MVGRSVDLGPKFSPTRCRSQDEGTHKVGTNVWVSSRFESSVA